MSCDVTMSIMTKSLTRDEVDEEKLPLFFDVAPADPQSAFLWETKDFFLLPVCWGSLSLWASEDPSRVAQVASVAGMISH